MQNTRKCPAPGATHTQPHRDAFPKGRGGSGSHGERAQRDESGPIKPALAREHNRTRGELMRSRHITMMEETRGACENAQTFFIAGEIGLERAGAAIASTYNWLNVWSSSFSLRMRGIVVRKALD